MTTLLPSNWTTIASSTIAEFKVIAESMPAGPSKDGLTNKIDKAEELVRRADAELAKSLGYPLCQCTWPPQIMLWKQEVSASVCPKCGHSIVRATKPVRVGPQRARRDFDIFTGD